MKKNMKIVTGILLIVVGIFTPIFNESPQPLNSEMITEWEEIDNSLHDTTWKLDEYTMLLNEIPYDFNNDAEKMDWFIEYKNIINQYPKELHNTKTIYDVYSDSELDLLFRIVQAEAGDEYGFIEKTNVVSVIFNRCQSENKTLTEILTAKSQFSPYSNGSYKTVIIDEKTILACEFVFMFGDTTDGCVAFKSRELDSNTWYGWTKLFSDNAHCFYK